jgi:hypothetical protein
MDRQDYDQVHAQRLQLWPQPLLAYFPEFGKRTVGNQKSITQDFQQRPDPLFSASINLDNTIMEHVMSDPGQTTLDFPEKQKACPILGGFPLA